MKKLSLFGLAALSVVTLAACSTNTTSNEPKKAEETTQAVETTTEKKTFAVGEKIVFEGTAEITVTGVQWTDERNPASDIQADKVLLVTYNVTNLTDEDYVVGSDIALYVNNKATESYPVGTILNTIAAGRSQEGVTSAFAVNEVGDAELEVKPGFQFTSNLKPAIVKIDLPA